MDKAFQADAFYYSEIFFTEAIADGVPWNQARLASLPLLTLIQPLP